MVYALGGVSGGVFNPAVSLALGLSRKLEWAVVGIYWVVQVAAGVAAGFAYKIMLQDVVSVGPKTGYTWLEALLAEVLYTSMLCFVVLNAACCAKNEGRQFYGLAIGFVIVAGAYGAGNISGGAFNPGVALGLSVSSATAPWGLAYAAFEAAGAVLAAAAFRLVRPDEFG